MASNNDDEISTASMTRPMVLEDVQDRAYLVVLVGPNTGEMYSVEATTVLGRGEKCDVRLFGDAISRQHARIEVTGDQIIVEDLGSRNGTFINGRRITREALVDGDKLQIGARTVLKFTYHDQIEEGFQRELYGSAVRDGLTKAFNRKYFADRLKSEVAYAQRHNTQLSLLMIDIDHFKVINDSHGHLVGDRALVAVARHINETIRTEDVFARYGGEEFTIICRGTDSFAAQVLATRIKRSMEKLRVVEPDAEIKITVSIGVATLPSPDIRTPEDLIARADEAMYAAKRAGRNRVVARRPPPGETP